MTPPCMYGALSSLMWDWFIPPFALRRMGHPGCGNSGVGFGSSFARMTPPMHVRSTAFADVGLVHPTLRYAKDGAPGLSCDDG